MTLKVIGAGFGRTGTASLKNALETLLHGRCYHMSEVLAAPGHVDLWLDAASGRPDWSAIFRDFVATVDFPGASYWRELAQAYPDAKVVLSTRDPERWFQSTQETIFSTELQAIYAGSKWGRMFDATISQHLEGDINDRDAMIAAFNAHAVAVEQTIDPDRLLVFEAKDGWAPLCRLLDVPEPAEPYPHVNPKQEFAGVLDMLRSPIGERVKDGQGFPGDSLHDELFPDEER